MSNPLSCMGLRSVFNPTITPHSASRIRQPQIVVNLPALAVQNVHTGEETLGHVNVGVKAVCG